MPTYAPRLLLASRQRSLSSATPLSRTDDITDSSLSDCHLTTPFPMLESLTEKRSGVSLLFNSYAYTAPSSDLNRSNASMN